MAEDLYYVNLLNDRKLLRAFDQMPDYVKDIIRLKVRRWTETLQELVVDNIQTRLNTKSGRLAESVQMEVVEDGVKIEGRVYIAGVPYARIQDRGGTIPAHIIRPRNAKVLAFIAASGDKVFATRVFHPGAVILASNYARDAYRIMSPKVTDGLYYDLVRKVKQRMASA